MIWKDGEGNWQQIPPPTPGRPSVDDRVGQMLAERDRYRQALQEIADGAIRCVPCLHEGVPVDATSALWRSSGELKVDVPVCSRCYNRMRHEESVSGSEPITQPAAVLIARKALEGS